MSAGNGKVYVPSGLHPQLKEAFAHFANPVKVVTRYDGSELGEDLRTFMAQLSPLSDKIVASEEKTESVAGIEIFYGDGRPAGIIYHAAPEGHEFQSFISALYNVAGPGKVISAEVEEKAKAIDGNKNIKIMVTMSCRNCPVVVAGAQRLATVSEGISVEVFDVSRFPDMVEKYGVKGVPCMIINDEAVHFGRKEIDQLFDLL